jgi:hypothetical protein
MPKAALYLMVLSGVLFASSAALADEVVIHHDGPDAVAVPPPDHHVVVEHDSSEGCQTKTVHKENDEGDSKTVSKTNCD